MNVVCTIIKYKNNNSLTFCKKKNRKLNVIDK